MRLLAFVEVFEIREWHCIIGVSLGTRGALWVEVMEQLLPLLLLLLAYSLRLVQTYSCEQPRGERP